MLADKQDRAGSAGYVWLLASVAALGGLLFGYDTAVISGAIVYMKQYWHLDPMAKGWAASSALVGCIVGAMFAGVLSDWLGRKKIMLLSALFFGVSAVGAALPQTVSQLAMARMLGGFAIGAASMLSPLYIAEIAPAAVRGRMVSLNQFAIVGGMLVVYFINALISQVGEHLGGEAWNIAYGWRWMFGSGALPAVLFFALLFFVPESPRWLIKRGRREAAMAVLTRINGDAQARRDAAAIEDAIAHEDTSVMQLFRPGLRGIMAMGIVLAVLQQVTGINVVLYYAPDIFKSLGASSTSAFYQTVIVGAVNLSFTILAIWVVDRIGRKPLLMLASVGMGISMFALGGAYALGQLKGALALVFVLAYVASFAVAMGPVVWVVLAEIYPTRVRGTAMSIATLCLWTACFIVSQTSPWLQEHLAGYSFFIYGAMCIVSIVFVSVAVPETKGMTLEQIERSWGKEK
jgi:sugar porter (SP) family MFS transporter